MSGLANVAECEALWVKVQERRRKREAARLKPPTVELYDGGFDLRGEVAGELLLEFEFIENDVGTATLQLPLDHYLAKWVMNHKGRTKRNVHVVIEKQGTRWSGCMDHYRVVKEKGGTVYLEVAFLHDYEHLKHIRIWCNPFLRAECQFPKIWMMFGPAKWAILTTLFMQILRLETSLWTLPDDPTDMTEWMGLSFLPSEWRQIVKPWPLVGDTSPLSVVFSRFGTAYDTFKQLLDDHQLTLTCRRYLHDRDEHPFEQLKGEYDMDLAEDLLSKIPLRNGCLVWDIEDRSGWNNGTALGGSWLTGFVRGLAMLSSNGNVEGVDVFTGDYTFPEQYYRPGFMGTTPDAPWVVFEEGPLTSISSSEFSYYEATDTSFLAGGESMPGVNEAISAGINIGGDLLTSLINSALAQAGLAGMFGGGAASIDLPPLGGLFDAVLNPLYSNVFMAFMEIPTLRAMNLKLPFPGLEDIATGLGDFHYYENMADGNQKAFTLGSSAAIAAEMYKTRARTANTLQISDASPYIFGERGFGHCWLGDRVGTSVLGYPIPDQLFVERIKKIKYRVDKDGPSGWQVEIGYREPKNPALYALEQFKAFNGALSTAGIL